MKYINIETPNGLVRIQLLQNSFIDKYIPTLQKIHSVFQSELRGGPSLGRFWKIDPVAVQANTKILMAAVNELNDMGLNFPYEVCEDSLMTYDDAAQDLLNKLHRAFTTANKARFDGNGNVLQWSDRFESAFTVPDGKMDRVMYLTEILNDTVHRTEQYIKTHHKPADQTKIYRHAELLANVTNDNPYSDLGPYSTLAGWFTNFTEEDYSLFDDSDEFDVWVGRDILGKDYVHAYYDCDDPTNWDVSGSIGYSGKISLDNYSITKSDILKSDDFRAWLASYSVEYTKRMGGMPLGNIVEGKEIMKNISGPPNHNIKVSFE